MKDITIKQIEDYIKELEEEYNYYKRCNEEFFSNSNNNDLKSKIEWYEKQIKYFKDKLKEIE